MPLKPSTARLAMGVMVASLSLVCFAASKQRNGRTGFVQIQASQSSGKEPEKQQAAADPSQYVGAETCKTCHEEQASSYDKGLHSKTPLSRHQGPEWQGCEACHGPGQEHAESGDPAKIIRFAALSRLESSGRCLKCHEFGQDPLWQKHAENKVGCLDCHSMHAPRVQAKLLKAPQPQLCASCHKETSPEFSRTFHHKRQ